MGDSEPIPVEKSTAAKVIAGVAVFALIFTICGVLIFTFSRDERRAAGIKDRQEMAAKMQRVFELADMPVTVKASGGVECDVLVIDGKSARKADLRMQEYVTDGKLHADLWARGFRELRIEYSESGGPKSVTVDLNS